MDGAAEFAPPERLFFALWPEAPVQHLLARAARELCGGLRGRAVPDANLHVTLAFLGDCTAARRTCLERAAAEVEAGPFELHLDRVEHVSRRGILWLGASRLPPELTELVARLAAALAPCGYEAEPRPFRAHVTLMRKLHRPPDGTPSLDLRWPVTEFALVRSALTREGALYTVLRRWPLAAGGKRD